MDIIECVPFQSLRHGKLEAGFRHAGDDQSPYNLWRPVGFQTEERIDVNDLATDVQKPCGHPCGLTPLPLGRTTSTLGVVLDWGWDRCQPTLFTGDDVARLDYQVDEVWTEVVVRENGELPKVPIIADEEVERWANPLRDFVLDGGMKFQQVGKLDVVLFKVVDCVLSPVRQPPLR